MTASLELLTPREVAAVLKVSYDSALDFIKYSGIKYIKVGRQYRVEEKTLNAFLAQKGNVIVDLQSLVR